MERRPEVLGAIRAARRPARQERLATPAVSVSFPAIYYAPGPLTGPLDCWGSHLTRAQRMGFRQVCTAPLSLSGQHGDLFLAADFDKPDPRLGNYATAEAAIAV